MLTRGHHQRCGRHIPRPRVQLVGIGDQAINAKGAHRLSLDLHCAAGDHQPRIRAGLSRTADRLARLAHGLGCDGAGIDDHHVALIAQQRAHLLALGQIHPAAQRDNLDAHARKADSSKEPRKDSVAGPVMVMPAPFDDQWTTRQRHRHTAIDQPRRMAPMAVAQAPSRRPASTPRRVPTRAG
jgi:hypothetical protein